MNNLGKSILIFFVLLFVFAKWGPPINFSSITQSRGEPLVVTGEGKVFVTPDIAKISFGIQENGSSLIATENSVNTKSKKLADALKKLGVAETDIKTTSYNVFPQYDYQNGGQRLNGYQVSTNYEVTIKNFDVVNDAITAGVNAGANVIGGISFDINDATKKQKTDEARKLAVTEAKEKATGLAGAAGITLGKIINISENQNGNIRPVPMMAAGDVTQKTVAQPEIQPGQTEIDITVSLSYEIR